MSEQVILNKTEKPNSFEFGRAGNRFKVYYDKPEELRKHIEELKKLDFEVENE